MAPGSRGLGRRHPRIVYHRKRYSFLENGGDQFSSGHTDELDWSKRDFENKCEIQSQQVGPKKGDDGELKTSIRIVCCTKTGLELEADPRHAELVFLPMKMAPASISARQWSMGRTRMTEKTKAH